MSKFVIADPHLDDAEILLHCRQQFCVPNPDYNPDKPFDFHRNHPLAATPACVEAHNALIRENWNRMVGHHDKVFVLGDFAFANHVRHLKSLNGRKVLIRGNHDSDMPQDALDLFEEVNEWATLIGSYTPKRNGGRVVYAGSTTLCHYPMRSWPGSCLGSMHIFGHSHGGLPEPDHLMAFDVGVDVWGFVPVPWDVIKEKFRLKKEEVNSSGGFSEIQDWTSSRQKDPLKRMLATRERNLVILRSMGVAFDEKGVVKVNNRHPDRDRIIEGVVAMAGTANKHGRLYTEETLRKLVDDVVFFWDDGRKSLLLRGRESVLKNQETVTGMIRKRLQDVLPDRQVEVEGETKS